jgi:hypothetical protein
MSRLCGRTPDRLQVIAHAGRPIDPGRPSGETDPSSNRGVYLLSHAIVQRDCSRSQSSAVWHSFCLLPTGKSKRRSAWSWQWAPRMVPCAASVYPRPGPRPGAPASVSVVNIKDWVGYYQGFQHAPVAVRAIPDRLRSPSDPVGGGRGFARIRSAHHRSEVRRPDRPASCLPVPEEKGPRADLAWTGLVGGGRENAEGPRRRRTDAVRQSGGRAIEEGYGNVMVAVRGPTPEGDANDVRPPSRSLGLRTAFVCTYPLTDCAAGR